MELHEIVTFLEQMPDEIYEQGKRVDESLLTYKESEHVLKIAQAKSYLVCKDEDRKRTVEYVQAMVDLQTEVEEARSITAEGRYRSEFTKLMGMQSKMDCVKKLANIEEATMRGKMT